MVKIVAVRDERELLQDLTVEGLPALLADPRNRVWVDISGPMEDEPVALMRGVFQFHSVTIRDCFESRENPKVEEFDGYLYVITHGLTRGSNAEEAEVVELDAFLSARYLVTYHALPSRSIEAADDAVRRGGGGPLRRGSGALFAAILGHQVDGIEPVLDQIEEKIDHLEERVVVANSSHNALVTMLALKRTVLQLRRWMSKQRDVVDRVGRSDNELVAPQEAVHFRAVHHHLQQCTDALESYREMLGSLQSTYLNVTNLKLGEIMKFLTVFTAILMPLTVITGIYGMNFEGMPELHSRWGYPMVLGLMAVTAGIILMAFKRRGWLERSRPGPEDAEGGIRKPAP